MRRIALLLAAAVLVQTPLCAETLQGGVTTFQKRSSFKPKYVRRAGAHTVRKKALQSKVKVTTAVISSGLVTEDRCLCEETADLQRGHKWKEVAEQFRIHLHDKQYNLSLMQNGYAWSLAHVGKFDEAIAQANAALRTAKIDWLPDVLDTKAYIELHHGLPQEALRDVNRALVLRPSDPILLIHRAMCFDRLGRTDLARADLETALSSSSYWPDALEMATGNAQESNRMSDILKGRHGIVLPRGTEST